MEKYFGKKIIQIKKIVKSKGSLPTTQAFRRRVIIADFLFYPRRLQFTAYNAKGDHNVYLLKKKARGLCIIVGYESAGVSGSGVGTQMAYRLDKDIWTVIL